MAKDGQLNSIMRLPAGPQVLLASLVGVAYFGAGKLGLSLATINASASPVWPPTGIAIAATLLLGYRVLPIIFAGAFLLNLTTAGTVTTSLVIALGNTLEGFAGAYLTLRFAGGRAAFDRPAGIVLFTMLAALAATTISATMGVAALVLSGPAPEAALRDIWFTWWLGDATGAIIVAPLIVLWANRSTSSWTPAQQLEVALLGVASLATGLAIFSASIPVSYVALTLVMWAAIRFSPREATTISFIVSAVAVTATARGFGPFVRADPNTNLLVLQGFVAVATLAGLLLGAVVAQRRLADEAVRRSRDELEVRVQGRTASLLESERRFSGFMMNLPGFAWVKDADGRYLVANPAFVDDLGKRPADVLGKTDFDLFPADVAQDRMVGDDEARRSGAVVRTTERRNVGGSVRFNLVHTFAIPDPENRQSVGGVAIDITARMEAEEKAVRSRQAMEEAQHVSHIGSWEWDVAKNVVTWSPELYSIYGLSPDRFQASYEAFLERVHPEDRDRVNRIVQHAYKTGDFEGFEHRILRPDGSVRWMQGRGQVTRDPTGNVIRMAGTGQDITEAKEAQGARMLALAQEKELEDLRKTDEFKSAFINMAAHELNTPLTPIKIQMHVLRKLPPEERDKSFDVLERNFNRMAILVQNMLDVGRIQSGKLRIQKGPIDVGASVEHAVLSFREVAKQAGAVIEAQATGDVWADADTQRVDQILFNLLSNALKFTPAGGHVLVAAERHDGDVVVRVSDTGKGLTPEQMGRLFKPFSQVHDTLQKGSRPGTGLGLYISRQLVELQGGQIQVASDGPGRGTTFTFTLPAAPPRKVTPPAPTPVDPVAIRGMKDPAS